MSQIPGKPRSPTSVMEDNVHRPAGDHEEVYFEGTPRLRGHLGHLFLYGLIGLLFILIPAAVSLFTKVHIPIVASLILVVIGLIMFSIPPLIVRRTRYRITNYRIDYERGWLSTNIDTTELWHVEDIKFHQSIFDRLLSVGTIEIFAHDGQNPKTVLRGIPNARQLFTTLEQRIIAVKRQQGVLKIDTGS